MKTIITFFVLFGAVSGLSEGARVFPEGQRNASDEEPVSGVEVIPASLDLIEFSGNVRLSCNASGSSLSYVWIKGSSEVMPDDRIHITDEGAGLTINNVTRNEHGLYRCNVSNPVNFGISDPADVFISFGPESMRLRISPSLPEHGEGSNVLLLCLAESRPSAEFQWFLNEVKLPNQTKPELRLTNIQMSQQGNYSCQAFNPKTKKNLKSHPLVVSVLARVSNVVVRSDSKDLVELRSSVSLWCSAYGSPHYFWMNRSSEVSVGDRVQISFGGSILNIFKVTRSDLELLTCHAFNYFSEDSSDPVNISIAYGPENVQVMIVPSQEHFEEGSNLRLICSADSRPAAAFQWFLNADLLPESGAELRLIHVNLNQTGNYSCQAFNNKTLTYQTSQPLVISVVESGGLSAGAIAGIIIACLIVLAAAAVGGYFIFTKRKEVKPKPSTDKTPDENVYETMSQIYERRM